MSFIKNKNYSFRASVFSNKLFSIIAATILLLLVDGGINNSANAQATGLALDPASLNVNVFTPSPPAPPRDSPTLHNLGTRLEALETVANMNTQKAYLDPTLHNLDIRMQNLEKWMGMRHPPNSRSGNLQDLSERLEALEQAFANNQHATQQTSVTQDITSTGNSTTQTPYPMAVCNALVNGQNLCTEQTVTAVVMALAVGLIAGIVAIVQTEINNKQNTDKQIENSKNLLTLLTLSQQKQQCVPSLSNNYTCP